jgi:hypothetical protein
VKCLSQRYRIVSHEGVKGTAHRATPIIPDPAYRLPFFVSFVLFVVNSLPFVPHEPNENYPLETAKNLKC